MRRKDREVTDMNELIKIIDQCKVCRIAMEDKDGLYIVPMNYGYSYEDNQLVLFFHSAKEGRKITALKDNSDVCIEMDCEHSLITGDEACQYSYAYKSIIGNGEALFIDDVVEKKTAMSILMKHQTGIDFSLDDRMVNSVSVFKIIVHSFTGKYHP
ncbi:MAG TPA: pyridoxamine 5'-phosphate oxidase family protein [Clostridiales bacterium]|nr:pyridoxamine 5'-phosphate oxidase family protein [Clostridiales bacterium]